MRMSDNGVVAVFRNPGMPMSEMDYDAPASLNWQHPPYGKLAADEHDDDFTLAEAVCFVMEHLPPDRRAHAKIGAANKEYGLPEIEGIYRRADFPRGDQP